MPQPIAPSVRQEASRSRQSHEVLLGQDIEVLERILEPGVDLALWERDPCASMSAWLEALPSARLPTGQLQLRAADVASGLNAACKTSRTPSGPERDGLMADIDMLATRFALITGHPRMTLTLQARGRDVDENWHFDDAGLHLLCTYSGLGAEWVASRHADAALRAPKGFAGPFRRMPLHTVALFRGRGTDEQDCGRGLAHRSPALSSARSRRFVLRLDELR
ncbi:DUF1826 domain-containing protein [Variovorax sp. ZS18.2.2]|uniref:DUF1826 domain-containing protein n=1 Tax=Variovorax sp. ZS18.2.2 TaxID=2971255 RepID=UPI0021510350|nr:DUF1826 domain-containing protein [Variovorax sp. ZS18.2.2]MCR6478177.1 DUF1826 domain-containing protein [Variovorax sp. ZS18.2.2]